MAGIKDVAKRAGVSTATVSRALSGNGRVSEKSRLAVLKAARELEFVLSYSASSLASGRNRNVGVVVPSVNRWYFSQIVDSAAAALLEAGYDLTLYNLSEGAKHRDRVLSEFLLRQRCDGVISVALELSRSELGQLLAVGKPVVGIGGVLPGAHTISVNDKAIATLATEHLLSLGHRRIAHIGGIEAFENDFRISGSRREGYEAAMSAEGLEVLPSWRAHADFTITGGYTEAKRMLGHPHNRPTAVFCASDEMAIGTILAARDLGLHVPEDLSVIGIDGHDLGGIFGLTTIAQFPGQQGENAVKRLLGILTDPENADTLPPDEDARTELVVRSSTSAPADRP
ncbi:LacI family DNA-binding transcriptional regulator [Arthrobacter sp. MSA 4-2]|uniref:LacI family DNA-binding transcriptional regulator n=1 Tax=Arthrobacter sp. MSA 4-2 TaxID=2794349 RepID=UPI0018E709F8|nr:LacI family DNA-binding transcriptional regulator [Arthrobacter sp. MSA 4-2]MBJ2122324.1 LacI family DNA-binding transcriptional regulator [Arthrobacter sp. MSA 4-2]